MSVPQSTHKLIKYYLFRFPQMFLLNPGDKVAQLVDWQLEVFDNLVQGIGERFVILVGENVVNATIFKEVLLQER